MPNPSKPELTWQEPLFDLLQVLLKHKIKILGIVAIGLCLGVARWASMDKQYKSSTVAVLLSRDKPIVDAVVDSASIETSDNAAARSASGSLMLPPNPILYSTLIQSRPVIDAIAEKFAPRLKDHLSENDRSEEIYRQIQSMITVTATEEGLLTVTVTTANPNLSADIANELFEECQRASKNIEKQLLLQQAGHLENALSSAKDRLSTAEKNLQDFSAKHRLVDVALQANNRLRNNREMESRKEILQEELSALLLSYTEKSPEVKALRAKIDAITQQQNSSNREILSSVDDQDFAYLKVELESLQQKVQFNRDLLLTLSTKADIYRIRAEQPIGDIAIIRPAYPSTRPAGPSKKKEIGIVLGVFILLAFATAAIIEQWHTAMQQSEFRQRVQHCRQLLSFRK